ncbi:peroxidase 40-like [Wolffia australiana]
MGSGIGYGMVILMVVLLLGMCWEVRGIKKECFLGGELGWALEIDVYRSACPEAEAIVFAGVQAAVARDSRMAASLLRLHFHDCFVNGCDGSVLLDDSPQLVGEKSAGPNANSLRGFDVVDAIKMELEAACPQTVSCADLLAIAARDAVALSGGPTWQVELGRMDSLTASRSTANKVIPGPTSNVKTLVDRFNAFGFSPRDLVALSGGHSIGKAKCSTFSSRLSGIASGENSGVVSGDLGFLVSLQELCGGGNSTAAAAAELDLVTPATFDNQYFVNLLDGRGLLASDQALVDGGHGEVLDAVRSYADDPIAFFDDFSAAMVKMGRIPPPAGAAGEVRRNCRVVN